MENRELIEQAIGWTACGFSLCLLFIPFFPFYKMIKGKLQLEDLPFSLVIITYFSCFCWFLYSNMLYSNQIWVINLIGMVLNGFLIIIYLIYEGKDYLKDAILNALIISFGSYLIYLILDTIIEEDERVGKICIFVVCILSTFQMRDIFMAYIEKNINYINIYKSWFTLITVTLWGFYGYMEEEYYVIIPQILFGFFSIIETFTYAHYKNNKFQKTIDKDEKSNKNLDNKADDK